jgi:hypothetical protein
MLYRLDRHEVADGLARLKTLIAEGGEHVVLVGKFLLELRVHSARTFSLLRDDRLLCTRAVDLVNALSNLTMDLGGGDEAPRQRLRRRREEKEEEEEEGIPVARARRDEVVVEGEPRARGAEGLLCDARTLVAELRAVPDFAAVERRARALCPCPRSRAERTASLDEAEAQLQPTPTTEAVARDLLAASNAYAAEVTALRILEAEIAHRREALAALEARHAARVDEGLDAAHGALASALRAARACRVA